MPEQFAALPEDEQAMLFRIHDVIDDMSGADVSFVSGAARRLRPNLRGSAVRLVEVLDAVGDLAMVVLLERASRRSRGPGG